jgi:hypothetical protein
LVGVADPRGHRASTHQVTEMHFVGGARESLKCLDVMRQVLRLA